MVIKKDPRAILDMLSKPVEVDEDEFLDKLDPNKSFALMPDKPPQDLDALNKAKESLDDVADAQVDGEEDAGPSVAPGAAAAPVELTKDQARFFSMFQGSSGQGDNQGSVPEGVNLAAVHASETVALLPRVGDTAEEREAKEEDAARRAAYQEIYAKEAKLKGEKEEERHRHFTNIYKGELEKK